MTTPTQTIPAKPVFGYRAAAPLGGFPSAGAMRESLSQGRVSLTRVRLGSMVVFDADELDALREERKAATASRKAG